MSKTTLFYGAAFAALLLVVIFPGSYAENQISKTEVIPIDKNIGIQKTVLSLSVPQDNHLPWGFVEGKIANPVPGYPVIIQIFDNDDKIAGNNIGAFHFAQTNVNEDGTYEYKFRIRDVRDGNVINIFEGDYTVKIFKVVYLDLTST